MADSQTGLSEEERAELERLRAEKASREQAAAEAAQRSELERLRREQAEAEADERDAARRERAREYMEPDEDLKMPAAQKLVLALLALVIVAFVVYAISGGLISN